MQDDYGRYEERPKKSKKPYNTDSGPRLKARLFVKVMAICELIASLYFIISEIICLSLTLSRNVSWYFTQVCVFGTGFWVGLVVFTDALIGVRLARKNGYSGCRITAHLVMSILATIATCVQLIFAGVQTAWLSKEERSTPGYYRGERDDLGLIRGNLAVNVLVCIVAVINIIFCLISGGLMCRNSDSCGCCSDDDDENVNVAFTSVSSTHQPQVQLVVSGVPVPPHSAYRYRHS